MTLTPTTGTYAGGTVFSAQDAALSVAACQDDFSDGVVGALWSDISSGGTVTESAALRSLMFVAAEPDVAALETVSSSRYSDNSVNVVIDPAVLNATSGTVVCAISNVSVDASTALEVTYQGNRVYALEAVVRSNAQEMARAVYFRFTATRMFALRLLRAGTVGLLFVNGVLVMRCAVFGSTNSVFSLYASGGSVRMTGYVKRPIVVFGGEPSPDVSFTGVTARGSTPAQRATTREVLVLAAGCAGTTTQIGTFAFTVDDNLLRFENRSASLTVLDPVLRR